MKTLRLINDHWNEYILKERVKILVTVQPKVLQFLENIKISDIKWRNPHKDSYRIIFNHKNTEFQFYGYPDKYSRFITNESILYDLLSNDELLYIKSMLLHAKLEQYIDFLNIDKKHYIKSVSNTKK